MVTLLNNDEFKNELLNFIDEIISNPLIKYIEDYTKFKEIILDQSSYNDYPSNPKDISLEIKDVGEKAFQRALLTTNKTKLDFMDGNDPEPIKWIDGELPVVLNDNKRRIALDLFGEIAGRPVLCELKYGKSNNTDSPIYAIIEILTYFCLIRYNAEILDDNKIQHKNRLEKWVLMSQMGFTQHAGVYWGSILDFGYPFLIIAANKSYWDFWFKEIDKFEFLKSIPIWGKNLEASLLLFETEDEDFETQKGSLLKYKPIIKSSGIWKRLKINNNELFY